MISLPERVKSWGRRGKAPETDLTPILRLTNGRESVSSGSASLAWVPACAEAKPEGTRRESYGYAMMKISSKQQK